MSELQIVQNFPPQVVVEQKAVLYQSTYDWWSHRTEHEELFDNAEDITATWRYTEKLSHEAKATWTLIKALKSSKVRRPRRKSWFQSNTRETK